MMECPEIFSYRDYRIFLRDLYLMRKKKFTRYSYHKLAKELGLKKSGTLNMVVLGDRKLSLEMAEKILVNFGWYAQQKKYFRNLVLLELAKDEDEKLLYRKEIEKILNRRHANLRPDQYAFYAKWYIPAIRELVALPDFQAKASWIAKALNPSITVAAAKEGFQVLQRLGLVKKEEERWVQSEPHLKTDPEVVSELAHNYHIAMLEVAQGALYLPAAERNFLGMTLSLSEKQFQWLRRKMNDFCDELQHEMPRKGSVLDAVYQLNLHFFPLVRRCPGKK